MKIDFRKFILIAFMISGMTALIYEIVWARPLQLIFGSTIYAVSTILTTFFVGFSLGSYAFRNLADKTKNPMRIFAFLELGIGIYGFLILVIFKILPNSQILFLNFLMLFFVLIIPSSLFGATWPIMNKAYIHLESVGKDAGKLYSANSFGSFIGTLIAGFLLIPLLGITKTGIFAASLNILVSLMLFAYIRKKKGGKNES